MIGQVPIALPLVGNFMFEINNNFSLKYVTDSIFYESCCTSVFLILCDDIMILRLRWYDFIADAAMTSHLMIMHLINLGTFAQFMALNVAQVAFFCKNKIAVGMIVTWKVTKEWLGAKMILFVHKILNTIEIQSISQSKLAEQVAFLV